LRELGGKVLFTKILKAFTGTGVHIIFLIYLLIPAENSWFLGFNGFPCKT